MYSYNEILNRMIKSIPTTLDKRQGSIIYNALAPAAMELSQIATEIEIYKEQTYLLTSTGINLDNRAKDYAMQREVATAAIRLAKTYDKNNALIELPIGSRFSTTNMETNINYILRYYKDGEAYLESETAGVIGNQYFGMILPLFSINNLGSAEITGTFKPAEDTESDINLRNRILDKLQTNPFAGNMAAYKKFTKEIDGVGDVKVFPIWNGGGTVKLSIVDGEFMPVTTEFVDTVQGLIDPMYGSGEGYGIAPIGHRVTVVTPTILPINVEAVVYITDEWEIGQLQEGAELSLKKYFQEIREKWSRAQDIYVLVARIIASLVTVEGIYNVRIVKINEQASDLIIPQTALVQTIPLLGTVTLIKYE